MNLEALIAGCKREDRKCQTALYNAYKTRMYTRCFKYMGSKAQAEDAFQEGWIKVFDNIKRFKSTGSLEGWIYRIMVNTCINKLRKDKDIRFDDINKYEIADLKPISSQYEAFDDISEHTLLEMIQSLPVGYKTVFLMTLDGYSHKEIGKALGIAEGSSRSQLKKAREKLINKLKNVSSRGYLFFI